MYYFVPTAFFLIYFTGKNTGRSAESQPTIINDGVVHDRTPGGGYDSDYSFLYQKQSELPVANIGVGVFARYDIPANELICEYKGLIFPPNSYKGVKNFRTSVANEELDIVGNTICAQINDCAWISNPNYTLNDLKTIIEDDRQDSIPTIPGFPYNARYHYTAMGKVLIYSTVPIMAHTEICYSYGKVSININYLYSLVVFILIFTFFAIGVLDQHSF